MIETTPDDTPEGHDDGRAFLLLRKHRYTGTVSYFLCWTPEPIPLARLIAVAVSRWRIEQGADPTSPENMDQLQHLQQAQKAQQLQQLQQQQLLPPGGGHQ
jgi:hypothetical protein